MFLAICTPPLFFKFDLFFVVRYFLRSSVLDLGLSTLGLRPPRSRILVVTTCNAYFTFALHPDVHGLGSASMAQATPTAGARHRPPGALTHATCEAPGSARQLWRCAHCKRCSVRDAVLIHCVAGEGAQIEFHMGGAKSPLKPPLPGCDLRASSPCRPRCVGRGYSWHCVRYEL